MVVVVAVGAIFITGALVGGANDVVSSEGVTISIAVSGRQKT